MNGTQANCCSESPYGTPVMGPFLATTTTVGSYAGVSPHPWVLVDVIGNVWEWCADWYEEYPNGEAVDPVASQSDSLRVYRGGSWFDYARNCRAAYRYGYSPGNLGPDLGFRVAADLSAS